MPDPQKRPTMAEATYRNTQTLRKLLCLGHAGASLDFGAVAGLFVVQMEARVPAGARCAPDEFASVGFARPYTNQPFERIGQSLHD